VQSKEGKLSDLIRDFKKFTSKNILKAIQAEPEREGNGCLIYLKKPQKPMAEIRIISFGNTEIMQKKYMPYILCGIS
jgi:hypothetical protein